MSPNDTSGTKIQRSVTHLGSGSMPPNVIPEDPEGEFSSSADVESWGFESDMENGRFLPSAGA